MRIGFLLFDRLTQLDLTGPFEVLASVPETQTFLIAKTLEPVRSDRGLVIVPSSTFETTSDLDVLLIPGGPGTNALLNDEDTLAFVRKKAVKAKYITSVCTGSLVLAAAGLLKGRRAATHWNAREFLAKLGAVVVSERVVIDLPFVTGGGVTAGIDFALTLVSEIYGEPVAKRIQLGLEYDPSPPFNAGSPDKADRDVLTDYLGRVSLSMLERNESVKLAAVRLSADS